MSAGVKFVARLAVRHEDLTKEVAELARMQEAFLRAYRNGGNGGTTRRGGKPRTTLARGAGFGQ